MARRGKKPRVKPSATREEQQGEENQDDDGDDNDTLLPRKPQRLTQLTKNDITFNNDKVREDSQDLDNRQVFNKTDEEYEKELAFCCFTCACPPKMKRKIPADDPYFQSGDGRLFHRRCCHGWCSQTSEEEALNFCSEYEAAIADLGVQYVEHLDRMMEKQDQKPPVKLPKKTKFKREPVFEVEWDDVVDSAYTAGKNRESEIHNRDDYDRIVAMNMSNDYVKLRKEFNKMVTTLAPAARRPCTVLDLFSGIGTSIVALKRLEISFKKVIHCEVDLVAAHVYKEQHYADSEAEFVHIDSFEEIFRKDDNNNIDIDSFMKAHGPIDLVIAGPPCQDFTPINARRKGLKGSGKYMLETAQLIKAIEQHPIQRGTRLFYVVENVEIKNDPKLPLEKGDKEQIQRALGHDYDPLELDALYFSPCARRRIFFTNAAVESHDFKGPDSEINPVGVLEDGFIHAQNWHYSDEKAKINAFMASKSRLDDERMWVFKKKKGRNAVGRSISVTERLALMGFPRTYLDPVKDAFQAILQDGHGSTCNPVWKVVPDQDDPTKMYPSKHWSKELDPKYHMFNGAYHGVSNPFKFDIVEGETEWDEPQIEMSLLQPLAQGKRGGTWLTAEQYAKRLIGNAMSVPVLEHLLKSLTAVYAHKEYPDYKYSFAWKT